jgi:O-methyltransferase domain/Dimerisation domain
MLAGETGISVKPGKECGMNDRQQSPSEILHGLISGYQVTQAINVAASLSIADLLATGPRTSDELAAATQTDPRALYRLLRALAAVGVFHEDEGQKFRLTPVGECLRSDAPGSMGDWARYVARGYHWQAWCGLADSVRTGENAFRNVHGVSVEEYRAAHTDEAAIFDRAMTNQSRVALRGLLDAFDFGKFAVIADIGGGQGSLLAALLTEYPAMRGVLFDQPHVVAAAPPLLEDAGVADRCEIVGGDFFAALPQGADAYLLKNILEGWDDDTAVALLRHVHGVLPADGSLLIIERVIEPPNQGRAGKFSDLNMLVSPGGENRTVDEFAKLFTAAGFAFADATPSASGLTVIQAHPAP